MARDLMIHLGLLILMPPLLMGVITKVKAAAAGRKGPPVLQPYFDVWKLLKKGAVYSRTTTWIFRAGPPVFLATSLAAGLIVPLAGSRSPFGFEGDIILFAYLLGLGRFFTMAAAMDTGSSFEGMGASREAAFSAFAEPALFAALAILCLPSRSLSFEQTWSSLQWTVWNVSHPAFLAAAVALFVVLLAENSRIPVDDPNTHLELTMIHEVMVLDHGGPDFAMISYGAAVKFFVMSSLLVHLAAPIPPEGGWLAVAMFAAGQIGVAVLVGGVESVMARLRLIRVPQFLMGAFVIALIGLTAIIYRGQP